MQTQGNRKIWYSLYGRMLERPRLEAAFRKVKAANGAPGVDGVSVKAFADRLAEQLDVLVKELKDKSYRPLPVLRVEIPKDGGGVRKLGIPSVRDRVVQQALLDILNPIFDPDFHPSSYGYRPGRSAHQAIEKASTFMRRYELEWVVDMDLSKCFDTLKHDFLLTQVRKRVADGSILNLIRLFLESGVMTDAGEENTEEGSPQGGVISPLLANIYLDFFDQWSMARGYRIVRYADDILIFASSQKGAERRLAAATHFLEEEMGLAVNREKTHITNLYEGVRYLGVVISRHHTRIQEKKVKAFKDKVRKLTRRNSGRPLGSTIYELNPVLRGFANYFRIANCTKVFRELMSWVRRRLRAIQLRLWKRSSRLHRRLRQLGFQGEFKHIKMSSWRSAKSPLAAMALQNKHFEEMNLFSLDKVQVAISVRQLAG
ncbi:group II intron reverse transcriptase/maturase [Salinispira pacifica]|uniref:Retron-type RNA-directed DNA polymerase n=1 Tax=Salinispira pacifica TaxID=1307761 RepID=V5WIZ6_9SPIO|nr:group II intron reverse transcriptase/maturase [Salinispira pacifica]AHC13676.1 Retron-type RNA-directed DNA polymerase [Salinispira pacifica]AHC15048.1 Retron-type RNA-directed DNA polymerase [Salinispira pacifica]AHC15141.1 Retron-type RNA-directed DNA polymerase [Salinispira pacifica]